MSRLFSLTKTLFKNNSMFGTGQFGKRKISGFLIFAILLVSFIPIIIMIWDLTEILYQAFAPIQQEGIVLALAMVIASFVIFIFGLFYVMGTLYLAGDLELLLPLPLKSWQVLISKLSVVIFYEYITLIPFIGPILIRFGMLSNGGIFYWVYLIIIFLLLPIVPLILITIIVMIIMRFTRLFYNRDRFYIIAGMLSLIIAFGVSYSINTAAEIDPAAVQKLFSESNGLVNLLTTLLPNIKFAVQSLINHSSGLGLFNLAIYILINCAAVLIFVLLGNVFYLKGAVGSKQAAAKRVTLSSSEIDKKSKRLGKVTSYTMKELKLLFRTPIYFLNCVLFNFIWPIFFLMPMLFGDESGLGELIKDLNKYTDSPYFLIGFAGVMIFIAAANPIASTAVSREGKNIIVSRFIPLSYFHQILGKILSGFILNFAGGFIILAILQFFTKLPIAIFILLVIILGLVVFASNTLNIIIDVIRPKLNWDNEQQAVKQNLNVVIGMFLPLLIGAPVVLLVIFFNLTFTWTYVTIIGYYILINLLLHYFVKRWVVGWYGRIAA